LLDTGSISHVHQNDSCTVAFDFFAQLGDVGDSLAAECTAGVPEKNQQDGRGLD
jgi:hypothetical protein